MKRTISAPDRTLVRRLRRGDGEAFEEFFDHYFPRLYAFSIRRCDGDAGLAEEVVQGTFRRAFASLRGYRGEAALFTWLCTLCRHELHGCLKRRGTARMRVEIDETRPEIRAALESLLSFESADPEAPAVRNELGRLVHEALAHLPGRYAEALRIKYLADLEVAEVARRLDLSYKAAESLLTRARAAFRESFLTLLPSYAGAAGDGNDGEAR